MDVRKAALHEGQEDRSSRAQLVVEECMRRRTAGESLSDERIITSHPDLMPELGQALRKLALIENAVRRGLEGGECGRLARSAVSTPPADHPSEGAPQPAPDSFPGYEITTELHRGGQAVVYRGVHKATGRKVAVKVMKEGPYSGPGDRARFDREVHILGQLNHPNIVTIHDSGVAAGHFYYTMDYISGQALDEWATEHGLGIAASDKPQASARAASSDQTAIRDPKSRIDASLRLFAKICEAVNAAHLRGVIHRDLKPSNIRIDTNGEPYVLDFGLAKVATSDSDASLMTITGQFVGSLPWASPEQAEGSPSKIDLRTDVYSLGVVLYHMLTSRFPYEVAGTMRDVLDRIISSQPARPSTIRRQIDDEVETIVLKCLAKERERRYQTGGELARDIRHYLAGEPIEAKRDSVAYLLRKQLRKYRLPVAVAVAFVVVVTAGFITSATFWGQAAADRDRALAAEHQQSLERRRAEAAAEKADLEATKAAADRDRALAAEQQQSLERRRAEAAAEKADLEAAKAEAVNEFLQNMLASVDPAGAFGREVTVAQVLDEAAREIEGGSLDEQPEVEADVHATIGNTYAALGRYPAAEPHLRRALELRRQLYGDEDLRVADSLSDLAVLLQEDGDYTGAEPLFREALALLRRLLGDEHQEVADAMSNLAGLLRAQGDYDGAEALYREALAMHRRVAGEEDVHVANSLNFLAGLLYHKGEYAAAEPLMREALAMRRRLLGDEHLRVADSLNDLAVLLYTQRDYAGAEPLMREALELRRQLLGNEHPRVARCLENWAMLLKVKGDLDQAEPALREALAMNRKLLGDEHPTIANTLSNLATVLHAQGEYAGAEPLCREALGLRRKLLGDEHPDVANSLYNLAAVLCSQGDWVGAEPLLREALAILRAALPAGHPGTASALEGLGRTLVEQGKFVEAEPLLRECLEDRRLVLRERHWLVARTKSVLGESLAGQGRFEEAEPLLLAGCASLPDDREVLERIVRFYEAWGRPEQAAEYRAKLPIPPGGPVSNRSNDEQAP